MSDTQMQDPSAVAFIAAAAGEPPTADKPQPRKRSSSKKEKTAEQESAPVDEFKEFEEELTSILKEFSSKNLSGPELKIIRREIKGEKLLLVIGVDPLLVDAKVEFNRELKQFRVSLYRFIGSSKSNVLNEHFSRLSYRQGAALETFSRRNG